MKTIVSIFFLIALATMADAIFMNPVTNGPRVCVIRTRACNWNSIQPVCGRQGTTSFCKRFQNECQYLANTCAEPNMYTLVNNNLCANLATNSRGICQGAQTGTGGGVLFPKLMGLNGGAMNSGVKIQPIIVRG